MTADPAALFNLFEVGKTGFVSFAMPVSTQVSSWSKVFINANNVVITTDPLAVLGDEIILINTGIFSGCAAVPATGQTIDGGAHLGLLAKKCAFCITYNAAIKDWAIQWTYIHA